MKRNTDQEEGYLEVQMDGKQVVIVVVGVLLLCAISFYFGRRIGSAEAAGDHDLAQPRERHGIRAAQISLELGHHVGQVFLV